MNNLKLLLRHRYQYLILFALIFWQALLIFGGGKYTLLTLVFGSFFCGFLPGLLAVIVLRARRISLETALYIAGLSILFNIVVGITANYVPMLFGVKRTLSATSVIVAYDSWLLLLFLSAANIKSGMPSIQFPKIRFGFRTAVIYSLALLGTAACVLGTFRLNNGADNLLSLSGLSCLILNTILVFVWRKRLPIHAYIIAIAGLSWGLLLLTSLRSNYISGQDLKQELRVYNITDLAGHWSMKNFNDSYNACLSITLYPFVLIKLLGVSSALMFKFIFQIIFVLCPLAIFSLLNSKFGKNFALLGSIFFLALPTLGLDLPLQARQQMSFLLLSLVILTWFNHTERWVHKHWQLLFILFSFAVIVSHYSTAYIFVGTLLVNFLLRSVLVITKFAKEHKLSKDFALSGRMIMLVWLFAFFWLGQVTGVSSNLFEKLNSSITSIRSNKPVKLEKGNTNMPYVAEKTNPLDSYLLATQADDAHISDRTYEQIITTEDNLSASTFVRQTPVSVQRVLQTLASNLYYKLGILFYGGVIIIGLISIVFRKRHWRAAFAYQTEYITISISILIILIIQVLLPGINYDYGITRAFIQAFIILCVPFIFGLRELMRPLPHSISGTAAVGLSITMLITYSGLSNQVVGGMRSQLNFNNTGPYYGAFYVRANDLYSYEWIEENIPFSGNVNAPDYSFPTALAYNPKYKHYGGGIFPFQVHSGNYVLLNYPQTQEAVTYISGDLQRAKVDKKAYSGRDLIYTNAYSEIYK